MIYRFLEIKTTRTSEEQAKKVSDEVKEFLDTPTDEEAVDILHAAETFIRVHFRGREDDLEKTANVVLRKNIARGYYTEKCY